MQRSKLGFCFSRSAAPQCAADPRRNSAGEMPACRRHAGANKSQDGGFHSTRARGKAGLFPELLPLPDAGSFVEDAVAELVGQHQNLTAMMRLAREHVSEHGPSGGPRWRPTAARRTLKRGDSERPREHPTTCAGTARRFSCARRQPASWCSSRDRVVADTSDAARNSSATKDGCCADARRWPRLSGHCLFDPAAGRAMHEGPDVRG
jgi:hypothetical protein